MIALLKFEFAKMVRSKLLWMGIVFIFLMVSALYAAFLWRQAHPRKDKVRKQLIDSTKVLSAPWFAVCLETPTMLVFFPMFVSVMGGAMLAGESRQGTLRTMLIRPVSRGQVLASKALMLVVYSTALMGFNTLMAWGIGFWEFPRRGQLVIISQEATFGIYMIDPSQSIERAALSYLLTLPTLWSLAMMALMFSVMFEQGVTAAMATMGVYFGSWILDELPFHFLDVIQPFLPAHYAFAWRWPYHPKLVDGKPIWDTMDWSRITHDLGWLAVWTIGYIVIASIVFSRKDVKA